MTVAEKRREIHFLCHVKADLRLFENSQGRMSSSSASTSNGSNVDHFEEGKYIQVTYNGDSVTGLVWSYAPTEGLLVMRTLGVKTACFFNRLHFGLSVAFPRRITLIMCSSNHMVSYYDAIIQRSLHRMAMWTL